MKRFLCAITLVTILTSSCSRNNNPAKWILFSKSKTASFYYTLDKMSKSDENLVKIWVKTVYNRPSTIDSTISYSKNMYMINCSSNSFKINTGFNYSATGEIVSKTDSQQIDIAAIAVDRVTREAAIKPASPESGDYSTIIRGSDVGRLASVVCR